MMKQITHILHTTSVGGTPAGLGELGHAGNGAARRDRALVGAAAPAAS